MSCFAYSPQYALEAVEFTRRISGCLGTPDMHSGYTQCYGLVWIDFRDQRRISGYSYGKVAAGNRAV